MSLDVCLTCKDCGSCLYESNITHNLNTMADKAGLYKVLWRPEEQDITIAEQLIAPLEEGLKRLVDGPDLFRQFTPPNNWGSYEGLIAFTKEYLQACRTYPQALVRASR